MLMSTSSPEARIEVALEPLRLAGNIKSGDLERVNLLGYYLPGQNSESRRQ